MNQAPKSGDRFWFHDSGTISISGTTNKTDSTIRLSAQRTV
jgi:hypothetical protein